MRNLKEHQIPTLEKEISYAEAFLHSPEGKAFAIYYESNNKTRGHTSQIKSVISKMDCGLRRSFYEGRLILQGDIWSTEYKYAKPTRFDLADDISAAKKKLEEARSIYNNGTVFEVYCYENEYEDKDIHSYIMPHIFQNPVISFLEKYNWGKAMFRTPYNKLDYAYSAYLSWVEFLEKKYADVDKERYDSAMYGSPNVNKSLIEVS